MKTDSPWRRSLTTWSRLFAVSKPFFVSSMRWKAWGAILLIVALLLTLNGLNVANSYVGRNFMTSISERNRTQYLHFAGLYVLVFAASGATAVTYQFVQDRLALMWRDWLTGHLVDLYLTGNTFESISTKLEIDNPDQRIAQDVRTFTSMLVSFAVMVTNSVLTTIAFAGVLWSITPTLLLTAILYAAMGSVVTVLVGYRLVALNNLQLKTEADLRYGLIHARESGEEPPISGQRDRGNQVHARLRHVVETSRAIIGVSRNVGFFTSGYNYLVQILPILIVAPRYLRGDIEFGVVTQSAMAFSQLIGAFSLIVAQFGAITAFTAVVNRIGSLWEEIAATHASVGSLSPPLAGEVARLSG